MEPLLRKLWRDEQGLELSEYAILAGLMIVLVIAVLWGIGQNIGSVFGRINDTLSSAASGTPGS